MFSPNCCSKCILPPSYPRIDYDADGTCSRCRQWDQQWAGWQGSSERLESVLGPLRGKTAPYDCVLGLSGGKDSAYAAYLCVEHGMSPLAVTYDNGFLTDWARGNIEAIVRSLGLAHIMISPPWEKLKPWYRTCLLKASEFCSACNVGITACMYRVAKAYGIHTVISGMSPRTEAASPPEFFTSATPYFHNVFGGVVPRREVKDFVYIGRLRKGLKHMLGSVRMVQIPRYVDWKEDEIIKVLTEKIGWSGELWAQHGDCMVADAKEYINLCKHGMTEKTAKLSSLVRDGQITRQQALEAAEEFENGLREREGELRAQLMEVFGLSEQELEKVTHGSHRAYLPKNMRIMESLKRLLYR